MSNVEEDPDKLSEVDRLLNDGRLKQHVYFKPCADIIYVNTLSGCLFMPYSDTMGRNTFSFCSYALSVTVHAHIVGGYLEMF